jgi:hypothetical protein
MWTGPQIEAESPRKQRGTLSRPRPVRRGKGKTGVGDTVEWKGVNQEGGGKATNTIPTLQADDDDDLPN